MTRFTRTVYRVIYDSPAVHVWEFGDVGVRFNPPTDQRAYETPDQAFIRLDDARLRVSFLAEHCPQCLNPRIQTIEVPE